MTGPLIVAVDGPSGAGKSTAARLLARRLGVPYLDTGAMYRALGLKVLESGVDPADREAVERLSAATDIRLEPGPDGGFEVLLDGCPVEPRIRTPEVGGAASVVSAYTAVRERMVALQRATAGRFGGVLEGRDIGTRVFPETPHKFFLDASPEVRFARRHRQHAEAGRALPLAEVAAEVAERDRRDRSRADSPLAWDESYVLIDASGLSADGVVERMVEAIAARE